MAATAVTPRRRIIERPRLTRLLDENPARIKLLVAPAGYGKTTLAQQWLADPRRRDVWYRAGAAAADIAALAAGIAAAAAEIVPGAGKRMRERLRAAGHAEDVEALAELLVEDVQAWPADAWLAIDDYHFAMDSAASERFIDRIVQDTALQMLVTSRRRPTWATARRILYGEIQELERRQLAMEVDEAKRVIGRDDADVAALLEGAQGWPAVIGLAASAPQVAPPNEGLPPALYDYFAEELYQRLAPELQTALCKLCVAPVITPELQRLLFGGDPAQVEAALGLGFLHEQDGTYAVHPLLRAFLEPKLAALGRDQLVGLGELVIDHLISTGAWDDAYDVIDRLRLPGRLEPLVSSAIEDIIDSGRITTLAQWLDFAARHHVTAPVLDLAEAELAFRQGRYGTAAALASNAARNAEQAPDYGAPLRARILLRAGQSALLDSREAEALDHFRAARAMAPTGSLAREALIGEFFSLVDLGLDEADSLLAELDVVASHGPEDLVRMSCARLLYGERRGGLVDALERAHDVYPLLDKITDPVITTSFQNSYGQSLALTGHYERALRIADEAASEAKEYRLDFVLSHAAILRALAAVGLRDTATALSGIAEAEQSSADPHICTAAAILRARLSLLRGDAEAALGILRRPLDRLPSDAMHAEYLASRGLAAAAAGDHRLSAAACEHVLLNPRFARGGTTTAMLVMAATGLRETSNRSRGADDAITFAFQGGRLDEFVVVYRAFPQLLGLALASPDHRDAVIALIGRANDSKLGRRFGLELTTPLAGPLGRLTAREQEVLALIAQGLTNKEIAGSLVISEATVKVHVRHVLEKLGAATRTEAASRLAGLPA
jgi:LuxR family maltose regulon positive regulatory protein